MSGSTRNKRHPNVGIGSSETSLVYSAGNYEEEDMLYAILAYHSEDEVTSWSAEEDAALMLELNKIHDRLTDEKSLGPAARLGATKGACVLRGPGGGTVTDGPFTESKEQLLGFYVLDCIDRDAAIAAARDLCRVNPGAIYEIRPVRLYRPGVAFPLTEVSNPYPS
jgi:hypothetical protein